MDLLCFVKDKDNVICDEDFLAQHPNLDLTTVGQNIEPCHLLVNIVKVTEPLDAALAAASACAIFCPAFFLLDDDDDDDMVESPEM